jgi:hypothetical protein
MNVIVVHAHRGDGSRANPERLIHLYFASDGRLLACHDPLNGPPDHFEPRPAVKRHAGR